MYDFNNEQKENILRFYPSIEEYILLDIRRRREYECFQIINRGKVWYDTLTAEQINLLGLWYQDWLNATETRVIPDKLTWLH